MVERALPDRFAGLPVIAADDATVGCHLSLLLWPADAELSADEFARRYLDLAEAALVDAIDRRGRDSFVGIAFKSVLDGARPALTILALRGS